MRLREFETDTKTGGDATMVTMINFLKKQAAKKGSEGKISINSLKNMMKMARSGGMSPQAALNDLQQRGVITSYDDTNVYFSDEPADTMDAGLDMDLPPADDPVGADMGGDQLGTPDMGDGFDMGMDAGGDMSADEMGLNPDDNEMMGPAKPDPVELMAKRAMVKRI